MGARGVLSRLGAQAPGARRDDVTESIIEHLRVLLNTRRGEAVTAPRYGVPDFTDLAHNFPGGIQVLQRGIRDTILEFEPRLKNVVVRHVPDDEALVLRFEITAKVADDNRILKVQTRVNAGGKIDIT